MGPNASRWSTSRPDRAELEPCCICDVDAGECRDGFIHAGRRWEIGITWPGNTFTATVVLDGVCRATVEDRYEPDGDDDYSLRYRGACVGCGRACDVEHDESNEALEDALDHALPQWRRVPVVEPLTHDAGNPQRARWLDQLAELYATVGLENRYTPGAGGLIRTMRQQMGTRSHWSNGFFDVCAGVIVVEPVTPVRAEQLGLF
jgi:Family of unknown function (DUF6349)